MWKIFFWMGGIVAIGGAAAWGADRNVMLIVADDLGLEVGCYGNPTVTTPNIDRLAASGTRFSNAYCSTASCSASRSVILTGLHNHANGQYGHMHASNNFHTRDWVKSLPALLNEAGYRSMCLGKLHVQPESIYPFDETPRSGLQSSRSPQGFADHAKRFIEQDTADPFFIYACSVDPHRDFGNHQAYRGESPVEYDPEEVFVPPFLPDSPECRAELAEYYQAVSRLDQLVGRLTSVLEETGHLDDTLVIFLSDNGAPFPGAKTTVYEPGIRLPLIVRSPLQENQGVVSEAMISWVDVVPTILDFTGAARPDPALHGRSFLDILDQSSPNGWDEVYASHTFHEITMYYPMRVVRDGRYKYILNLAHPLPFPFASDLYSSKTWQGVLERGDSMYGNRTAEAYIHRPRHELYDLENDPHELTNLVSDPEFADTLATLQKKLKAWQKRTQDPWTSKYIYE